MIVYVKRTAKASLRGVAGIGAGTHRRESEMSMLRRRRQSLHRRYLRARHTARPVDGYECSAASHRCGFQLDRSGGMGRRGHCKSGVSSSRKIICDNCVPRSELAMRLQGLGCEIERGKHGQQPEIKGYSQEYLEASSSRRVRDQRTSA